MNCKLSAWIRAVVIVCSCVCFHTDGLVRLIKDESQLKVGVENEYVIVLKTKSNLQRRIKTHGSQKFDFDWEKFKEDLLDKASVEVSDVITFGDFNAAMVKVDSHQLEAIRDDLDIDYIEMNREIELFRPNYLDTEKKQADLIQEIRDHCFFQKSGFFLWGLSRLSQRDSLDEGCKPSYSWAATEDGQGVHAYVVDTGIYLEHPEFETRAKHGFTSPSIAQLEDDHTDHNGHGTHVAGTIGGRHFGVAKGVDLVAVKVLNAEGRGTLLSVIQGLEFVYIDHMKRKQTADRKWGKSVVNLSLGAKRVSPLLEQAVAFLVEHGITVVAAAGNSNRDACQFTPARSEAAITVAATTIKDELSFFSNFGPCVDILAPGSGIFSAFPGKSRSKLSLSGTSMAAPHVTGAVARYLSQFKEDKKAFPGPSEIKKYLLETATDNKINLNIGRFGKRAAAQTSNMLLNVHCEFEKYSTVF